MVFGFNNFNMMNMFPMNFGSFGFGSFGCGTGYSNFGSSLFGCGFGNNYLNPTNCDGSTNWGSVGFGLTAAFAPMLLNWGVGAVEKAIQNSNGNQQEVVAEDIQVLQGRVDEALKELGSGVTESNYTKYNVKTESWYTTELNTINENILDDTTLAAHRKTIKDYDDLVAESTKPETTAERKAEINNLLNTNLYNAAKEAVEAHEKALKDLEALEKKATEQQKIKNEKIKEIADLIEQRDKAKAELEELRLDDYDGAAIQRTRKEDFVKRFNISNDKDFSYNDINNVTKSDVLYIINQYKTATPENKEKWKKLLGKLWNDNGLDPDIRNSSDCRGGYKLICG